MYFSNRYRHIKLRVMTKTFVSAVLVAWCAGRAVCQETIVRDRVVRPFLKQPVSSRTDWDSSVISDAVAEEYASRSKNDSLSEPERAALCVYYSAVLAFDGNRPGVHEALVQELQWFALRRPRSLMTRRLVRGGLFCREALYDPSLQAIWQRQIARYPNDFNLLCTASYSFHQTQSHYGILILRRALELRPHSNVAAEATAELYRFLAEQAPRGTALGRRYRNLAYQFISRAADWSSGREHVNLVERGAHWASMDYAFPTADPLREVLMERAVREVSAERDPFEMHRVYELLGVKAIKIGRMREARRFLRAAGRTSAVEAKIGSLPTTLLPALMLQHGEVAAVLEFLAACRRNWLPEDQTLIDEWISQIRAGKRPNLSRLAPSLEPWRKFDQQMGESHFRLLRSVESSGYQ